MDELPVWGRQHEAKMVHQIQSAGKIQLKIQPVLDENIQRFKG